MLMEIVTVNGKKWKVWKQHESGANKGAVDALDDLEGIYADAAPTKLEALELIEHMAYADNKEKEKWK